jgi:hypothetical protein
MDKDNTSIYRSDDDDFFEFVLWLLFTMFWALLGLRVYDFIFGGRDNG